MLIKQLARAATYRSKQAADPPFSLGGLADGAKAVGGKAMEQSGNLLRRGGESIRRGLDHAVEPSSSIASGVGNAGPMGAMAGTGTLLGAGLGGLSGLMDPGKDEEGNKRSRIAQMLKRMGMGGVAGGVGGLALGSTMSLGSRPFRGAVDIAKESNPDVRSFLNTPR